MEQQIQKLLQVSAKLFEQLSTVPKSEERDAYIEDIQQKSAQLNTVVHAVKGMGESVNGLNASVQQITSSISNSVEQNEEKIAQVVQWSNVAMGIADKWKKRKVIEQAQEVMPEDVYSFEPVQADKPKRKWGRKK